MAKETTQVCRAGTCEGTRATRGFTLIELLVVMTILSISLLYVVPKMVGREEAELKGSARRLLHTVRRLSDEALFERGKRVLSLDVDKGEYWEGDGQRKWKLPDHVSVRSVVVGTEEIRRGVISITCFPSGLREEASIQLSGRASTTYTVMIPAVGERFELRQD